MKISLVLRYFVLSCFNILELYTGSNRDTAEGLVCRCTTVWSVYCTVLNAWQPSAQMVHMKHMWVNCEWGHWLKQTEPFSSIKLIPFLSHLKKKEKNMHTYTLQYIFIKTLHKHYYTHCYTYLHADTYRHTHIFILSVHPSKRAYCWWSSCKIITFIVIFKRNYENKQMSYTHNDSL